MRTTVYVSGPYTSDPEANTHKAIAIGNFLLDEGYAPFVPHLSHYWHEHTPRHYEDWMAIDLAWIEGAHAVLRLPGESEGADREVAHAQSFGIPIFYDLGSLIAKVDTWTPERKVDVALPVPIAQAIDKAIATFASKNADYAEADAWRSNFDHIADQMGFDAVTAADTLIAVKQARLQALKANGRTPKNEAVEDTYLDRMVYAIIAYGLLLDS